MTHYNRSIEDPVLTSLNKLGWTDQQIADARGYDRSIVNHHRKRLGLPPNHEPRVPRLVAEAPRSLPETKVSPVELARAILGRRAVERNGGYWLDGCPVSTVNMVKEANRVRVRDGEDQFGPPGWRV